MVYCVMFVLRGPYNLDLKFTGTFSIIKSIVLSLSGYASEIRCIPDIQKVNENQINDVTCIWSFMRDGKTNQIAMTVCCLLT